MAEMNHIQMIVFDWAGTTTDYGGVAPSVVFDRVFQEEGICLTKEEINAPMGMEKKAHIRALLSSLSGGRQWKERYGTSWTEEDAERLYEKFEGILYQMVAEYSVPIPGVVDTVQQLRKQGLKIGSTTGYTSQMMKQVLPNGNASENDVKIIHESGAIPAEAMVVAEHVDQETRDKLTEFLTSCENEDYFADVIKVPGARFIECDMSDYQEIIELNQIINEF